MNKEKEVELLNVSSKILAFLSETSQKNAYFCILNDTDKRFKNTDYCSLLTIASELISKHYDRSPQQIKKQIESLLD